MPTDATSSFRSKRLHLFHATMLISMNIKVPVSWWSYLFLCNLSENFFRDNVCKGVWLSNKFNYTKVSIFIWLKQAHLQILAYKIRSMMTHQKAAVKVKRNKNLLRIIMKRLFIPLPFLIKLIPRHQKSVTKVKEN
mgnify:CR=1 FL=1